MNDEKMAARINALFTLAEHPGTPEAERLAAAEKATELMEKYAITELMARGVKEQHSDKVVRHDYSYNGVYSRALRDACCRLADALDMRALYYDGILDQTTVVIYGFESDFNKFEALLTSLMLQMTVAFKMWKKVHAQVWSALDSRERFYSKRSFMMGYGKGFASRVEAGRSHAVKSSGTGAELVLVDRKSRVEDHVEQEHPNLKKSRKLLVNAAFDHGHAAGSRASTGETTIGTRKAVK